MDKKSNSKKAITNYYDHYSGSYEQERRQGYYSLINDLEFEKIEPLAIGANTLEVGCGTGLILERTAKIANKAIGVDISDGMLKVCSKKGLNVQRAQATCLPFKDNCFDLVYSFKVLPHVPNIGNALAEIARVTKPCGRMILEFYNPLSFKGFNYKIATLIRNKEPVYVRHDRPDKLNRLFPRNIKLVSKRGVRIFAPCACFYTLPLISIFFRKLDRFFCDTFISIFAGYYIIEAVFFENCE